MNLQLVYQCSLSLSKNEKIFYEKTRKQNKTKGPETKAKKVSNGESRTPDLRVIYCPTTTNVVDFP